MNHRLIKFISKTRDVHRERLRCIFSFPVLARFGHSKSGVTSRSPARRARLRSGLRTFFARDSRDAFDVVAFNLRDVRLAVF